MHDTALDDVQVSRELWAQRRNSSVMQEGLIWPVSSVYAANLDASRSATELLVSCVAGLWGTLEQIYPICEDCS